MLLVKHKHPQQKIADSEKGPAVFFFMVWIGCKNRAAGKIKSFLIQQFFKNVGEVWASSPDRC
ncbi:MAG TPA: hypothetical protein DCM18_04680, partial [Ruminococcus sp.]|nr:hypothetical protein [Ruminococcus sp.]